MRKVVDLASIEMEMAALRELAKFHIDCSKYRLEKIEREHEGEALLTFNGDSEGNIYPQALVLFTKMLVDWDIRVDLTFDAKIKTPCMILKL